MWNNGRFSVSLSCFGVLPRRLSARMNLPRKRTSALPSSRTSSPSCHKWQITIKIWRFAMREKNVIASQKRGEGKEISRRKNVAAQTHKKRLIGA